MKHDIYEMQHAPEIEKVLEELRTKVAQVAGITIMGNRLTIRWGSAVNHEPMKYVHAVIVEVDDGDDGDECPTCENLDVYYDEVAEAYACHTCGWHDEEPPKS